MPRKKTLIAKVLNTLHAMVSWESQVPEEEGHGYDVFSRLVVLHAETEDGRPIVMRMTPAEAYALGQSLQGRAAWVAELNREHRNGNHYPDRKPWAVQPPLKPSSR